MLEKIDIKKIIVIAREAGKAILDVYNQPIEVESKEDHSPITLADKRSNDIITGSLRQLYPDIPVLSEESKQIPFEERKSWSYFWLVDPLDGTKEFIKKNGEFTVNIALIHQGEPVVGVVYQPVTGLSYYALQSSGAFKTQDSQNIRLRSKYLHYAGRKNIVVIGSRSHQSPEVQEFVDQLKNQGKSVELLSAGSSLKFCLVAEGAADVYPRFGPTMEWDTAAAHVIATEAGRKVLDAGTRQPLQYNKENLLNPWFIVE